MHSTIVSEAGGHFDVELLEDGDGPPLLYLHSAGGLLWDPFHDALAQRYHLIAPYIPGTGRSTGLTDLADHHDLFFFYLELLDALDLDQVRLIGHSMGGWIAAELAALAPTRIQQLVLIAPIGLWNDQYPVADFLTLPPSELVPAVFHDTTRPEAQALLNLPTDPDELQRATITRAKIRAAAARFLWPIPDKGLARRIHRIAAPTLILWGDHDGLLPPQYGDDFQAAIPNSRLIRFQHSGHIPHLEERDLALQHITAFLDG